MKNTYFGWEFRPAVTLFTHKACAALGLPDVTIEWTDGVQTAAISSKGKIRLANVRDDAVLTRKDLAKYVGFVIHELLHRKYTNFNVRGANQYIDSLHNAIEDAWIESLAIKANLTGNIAELLGTLIDDMSTQALDHVQSDGNKIDWSDPAQYPFVLAVYARPHATIKVPVAKGLKPIFDEANRRTALCSSSFDTLAVAVWVYERLNMIDQEQPPQPPVHPEPPPRGKPSDKPKGKDVGQPCDDGEPAEGEEGEDQGQGGNGNDDGEDGQGDQGDEQGDTGKGDGDGEGDGSGDGQGEAEGDDQGQGGAGVARPPVRVTAANVEPQNRAPKGTESTGTYSAQFRLARDAYHVGDSPKFNLKG
tara:strand:- start:596 stop:1681 length:1086 start_codon:yes stop_codon:yes gene_type:complete